jgi:aryl-alcohol dehydrogenase-like predicted oxidoreductase
MNYRVLGRTGIKVSEIAFGCVEIGIPYGIGVRDVADMPAEAECMKMLHAARDAGINFYDTARLYGKSENILGRAFRDQREKVVISTKCKHLPDSADALNESGLIRDIIRTSLDESLSALQTDYIDLFMLHNAEIEVLENETVCDTFVQLKKSGAVRAIGVSTYRVEETEKAIESGVWDSIQLPFNLMDQRQHVLFKKGEAVGVGIVIRSVLLKGILSDRGRNLHPALRDVESHRKLYDELMDDHIPTLPMLATKFALSFSSISSVLVGIDREEYLRDALKAADGRYLEVHRLRRAQELAYPEPEFLNLPEWDRKGWL